MSGEILAITVKMHNQTFFNLGLRRKKPGMQEGIRGLLVNRDVNISGYRFKAFLQNVGLPVCRIKQMIAAKKCTTRQQKCEFKNRQSYFLWQQ